MTLPTDPSNPYASPFGGQAGQPQPVSAGVPVYAKTMFIVDLVFCVLRLPLAVMGIVGYIALSRTNDPLLPTVAAEIATAFGIVIFGITANVLGLLQKRLAIWAGLVSCLATLGSVGVGLWQATIKMADFAVGSPERIGGYIGLVLVLAIRLGIVAAYVAALVQFAGWIKRRSASSSTAQF